MEEASSVVAVARQSRILCKTGLLLSLVISVNKNANNIRATVLTSAEVAIECLSFARC
jgi:hypothetical protein